MNVNVKRTAILGLAILLALPIAAAGLSLGDAKSRGMVGEQYDGYLGDGGWPLGGDALRR